MEIDNPYLERRRELIVEIDKLESKVNGVKGKEEVKLQEKLSELRQEFEKIDGNYKEYTLQIREKLEGKIEKIVETTEKTTKDYPSLNQMYRSFVDLHREAKKVTDLVKEKKYEVLEELKAHRERKRSKN